MARWGEWWRVTRYTLFTGALPQVEVSKSVALRRLRVVIYCAVGIWAAFVAALTAPPSVAGTPLVFLLALLVLAPALVAVRSPLWAWRLALVLIAITPLVHPGSVRQWGWAWSPGLALVTALVLYVVAESHTQAVVARVAVVTAAFLPLHVGDWRNWLMLVVLMTVLLVLGNTVRQRRIAERQRAASATRNAVFAERARIARELHDVVAHHMSVLALRTDSARFRFPELPGDVRTEFAELSETAREGMVEMRRLLGVLRAEGADAGPTAPQPTAAQIAELAERVRSLGMDCELDVRGEFGDLPAGVALSVYRIVQEALSNAARHATGSRVVVELAAHGDAVGVTVRNSAGGGVPERGGPGHGLLGMRERVAMLGGTLEAGATGDGGFRVAARLPVGEREGGEA
ncbi:sensor histidine kinase [Amycolatopsis magusensis]|uniref:sensor histidine kinase n=1 Tax=Amycolatopsis magusensis TaxID=882444 RepID=UPI003C2E4018